MVGTEDGPDTGFLLMMLNLEADVRELFLDAQFITIERIRAARLDRIEWEAAQAGRVSEWRRAHPERRRAHDAAYRARHRKPRLMRPSKTEAELEARRLAARDHDRSYWSMHAAVINARRRAARAAKRLAA